MDFRAVLLEQTQAFGELIRNADPATPVPTCPGWTFKELFRHVGRGDRWAAQIVADRRTDVLDPRDVRDGKPPEDPDAAIEWLNQGAQLLLDAVEWIGSEMRVWTFLGPRPPGWWIRRRVHETSVHRADAELALGRDVVRPPELAADGVGEWLERIVMEAKRHRPSALDHGMSLHLHATDPGLGPTGEWTVVNDEDGMSWSHSHGDGTVALRGPATELLLTLTRRRTPAEAGVDVFGDTAVWDAWLDRTPF